MGEASLLRGRSAKVKQKGSNTLICHMLHVKQT
jgi:hypothetical protein